MFSTGFTSLYDLPSTVLLSPVFTCLTLHVLPLASSSLCTVFDVISSNVDELLSINPSANVFVFGDFNAHHKDWLTYSGGTDRSGELCYNFSIWNGFTQKVNFPTQIRVTVVLTILLFWIYFFFLRLFVLQKFSIGKFWSCGYLGFYWLSIKLKTNASLHRMAYDYSRADWDGLSDHLIDGRVSLNSVLLLLLVTFVIGFRLELIYISLVNIRSNFSHLHGFQLFVLLP